MTKYGKILIVISSHNILKTIGFECKPLHSPTCLITHVFINQGMSSLFESNRSGIFCHIKDDGDE